MLEIIKRINDSELRAFGVSDDEMNTLTLEFDFSVNKGPLTIKRVFTMEMEVNHSKKSIEIYSLECLTSKQDPKTTLDSVDIDYKIFMSNLRKEGYLSTVKVVDTMLNIATFPTESILKKILKKNEFIRGTMLKKGYTISFNLPSTATDE